MYRIRINSFLETKDWIEDPVLRERFTFRSAANLFYQAIHILRRKSVDSDITNSGTISMLI